MKWGSQVAKAGVNRVAASSTYIPVVSGTVMVGVMNGAPLVGSGDAVCVGVGPCGFVLVGVLDGAPIVGGDVSVTVGVRPPVGSTVLMLLVSLGPVDV